MTKNQTLYDLAIIGGGINGCGIAADAAGRGLKVYLCEKNDLASGTSSMSSKLIHGGLRYLEHYEFRLVKESLAEREVMLAKAPHLVTPLKFTLPHRPHLRPAWMIRAGLFLYDNLTRRNSLPKAKSIEFNVKTSVLTDEITKGFEYFDCWTDDARLVVSNAIQARDKGAHIHVYTEATSIQFDQQDKVWIVELRHKLTQKTTQICARHIINAAGPWLNQLYEAAIPEQKAPRNIRLIKGSHLIIERDGEGDGAFILQNKDKRIVFVLPYLNDFLIIGTTDKEYQGKLDNIQIDEQEQDYLLDIYNQHFKRQLSSSDIVSSYSGVRPLCDDESNDPSAITRDYTIEMQTINGKNALISIYGGKITTYRKLGEAVLKHLHPFYPSLRGPWTATQPLPGVKQLNEPFENILSAVAARCSFLNDATVNRYARSYGHLAELFLKGAINTKALGINFGADLYQAEVDYLIRFEWAFSADDILWRRTKLGLKLNAEEQKNLDKYVKSAVMNMN